MAKIVAARGVQEMGHRLCRSPVDKFLYGRSLEAPKMVATSASAPKPKATDTARVNDARIHDAYSHVDIHGSRRSSLWVMLRTMNWTLLPAGGWISFTFFPPFAAGALMLANGRSATSEERGKELLRFGREFVEVDDADLEA
jgi:hypothetical protein